MVRAFETRGLAKPARRAVAMLLAAGSILKSATVGAAAGGGTPVGPATLPATSTTDARPASAEAAPVVVAPVRRSIPKTPPANEARATGAAAKSAETTGVARRGTPQRGAKPVSAQPAVTPAPPARPK